MEEKNFNTKRHEEPRRGEEKVSMEFDALSNRVIGCAIEVHKKLGPGLLESAYERCLSFELTAGGVHHEIQKELPIEYKGVRLNAGYRVDVMVENELIVELKSVESLHPIYEAQLLTYMRLSGIRVGLLINFNVSKVKDGIKRYVL